MQRYNNTVVSPTGQAIAGASIIITVAANPPGTGTAALVFGDDGVTPVSNTVIADNLGRFGFFVPDGKYDLTVSGGTPPITIPYVLVAVEITDLLEFNTLDSQPITVQTLNLTQVTGGAIPPAGTINLYSKTLDSRLYYKDPLGTEIGPLVAGGGSGSPAGVTGDVQKNSGTGLFAASSINDNGINVNFKENVFFRGPNPYVDVQAFGARPIPSGSTPLTTASIGAGTNTAAVANTSGFVVGDGLTIVGAGSAHGMATPTAPIVTPAAAKSGTGTGFFIGAPAGSTSYSYVIVMRNQNGGFTAASAAGTTSTGTATLGHNTLAITSITASGNIYTVTVGSTAQLAVGFQILIKGTTDDPEFGGWRFIDSIIDGTHFTYKSGNYTYLGMNNTTATGGNIHFYLCNDVQLPAATGGGTQYWIYGRTAGSLTLLAVSTFANLGYTDESYLHWQDFGSPMMDGLRPPWWAPATPPISAVNNMLTTTITGIVGSSFTLAANAGTSVAGAQLRFDNAPNILAAYTAANTTSAGGGGAIHLTVPVETGGGGFLGYVTSSYLKLPGTCSVLQSGSLFLGDTLDFGGVWEGTDLNGIRLQAPAFALEPHVAIAVLGANPGIFLQFGNIDRVSLQNFGNSYISLFTTQQAPMRFRRMTFAYDGGAGDFMGIAFYSYVGIPGGGFGGKFSDCTFTGGPVQVGGACCTPVFISKYGSEWNFDNISTSLRGFYFAIVNSGLFVDFSMGEEAQGPITPLLAFYFNLGGNVGGAVSVRNTVLDTSGVEAPIIGNLTGSGALGFPITLQNVLPTNLGIGNLISGKQFFGTIFITGLAFPITTPSILGQNSNLVIGSSSNGNIVGLFTSQLALGQTTFANLGTPSNGIIVYCSDCTMASPCGSGGTGALAKRLGGQWVCN